MLVGYFEGIDSERGIAWRASDSLGLRRFLRMVLEESGPDHSTISRTRRRWEGKGEAQAAVYANRRRIRGEGGKKLLRQRGEKIERSFAHCYETGGLRRVHLPGHRNILKRVLVHVAGFNLGVVMRRVFGQGTPRGLQGHRVELLLALWRRWSEVWALQLALEGPCDAPGGISRPQKP
ncbi:MAG: transposase [Terriglobia bacterium]